MPLPSSVASIPDDSFKTSSCTASESTAERRVATPDQFDSGRPGPWRRRGLMVLSVVVGSYFLYVAVLNVAFATGAFTNAINGATTDAHLEFRRAWTLLPGRVHVDDAKLRVEDRDIQFGFGASHAVLDIDVFALAKHTVRFRHADVVGAHVSFRRKTLDPNEPRVTRYPKIAGFPPFARKDPTAEVPRTPEQTEKLWHVEVNDVDGLVDELWIEEFRYQGRAHVRGGFRLDPTRVLRIDPTKLELREGALTFGPDERVATGLSGTLQVVLPPIEVATLEATILSKLEVRVELTTKLQALPLSLYGLDSISMGADGGELDMSGALVRGVLQSGARAKLSADVRYSKTPVDLRGRALVMAYVREEKRLEIDVHVPEASATFGDAKGRTTFALRAVSANGKLDLPTVDAPIFAGARVSMGSADASDIRFLATLLGPEVARGGRLHATFRGDVDGAYVARGQVLTDVAGLDLAFPDARMKADARVSATYDSADMFAGGRLSQVKVTVPIASVRVKDVPERRSAVWAAASAVTWTGLVPATVKTRVAVTGSDSRILTAFVEREGGIGAMATRSLIGSSPFQADASLQLSDGTVRVRLLSASAGKVTVQGGLVEGGSGLDAAFLLRALGLSAGLAIAKGEVSVEPLRSQAWLDTEMTRLSLGAVPAPKN